MHDVTFEWLAVLELQFNVRPSAYWQRVATINDALRAAKSTNFATSPAVCSRFEFAPLC